MSAKTYLIRQWARKSQRMMACVGSAGFLVSFVLALTRSAARRDTAAFLALLEAVVAHWTEGHRVLILDHLSIHKSLEVRLWALAHPRVRFWFQPTYLPWWKTLRGLAHTIAHSY